VRLMALSLGREANEQPPSDSLTLLRPYSNRFFEHMLRRAAHRRSHASYGHTKRIRLSSEDV